MNQAEIELALRLESIFMPYATRQRYEAFERQKDANGQSPDFLRVVHYTTAEAALKIIGAKRLWMRNTSCMDDYQEVQHGMDILAGYFNKERTEAFCAALDEVAPGQARDAINKFNGWWGNHLGFNIFVSSVAEHASSEDTHGRLSMWRAFGDDASRVAIVIKIPKFTGTAQALGLFFSPVAYLKVEEVYEIIAGVLGNVAKEKEFLKQLPPEVINSFVFQMLLAGVACMKHEGFGEEREWRAVYTPQIRNSALMLSSIEVVRGVPQHVFKLPLDKSVSPELEPLDIGSMIDCVIIGPTPFPWVISQALVQEMARAGVPEPDKKIYASRIPIRSNF